MHHSPRDAAILSLGLACLAAAAPAAAQQVVSRFNGTGSYAEASFHDPGTGTTGSITVYQDGSRQNPATWVFAQTFGCIDGADSYTCSATYLWGSFPPLDFVVRPRGASLDTDGESLSGEIYTYTCPRIGGGECIHAWLPVTDRSLALNWTTDSEFETRSSGTTQTNYSRARFLANGSYTVRSATAEGTVLGKPVSGFGAAGSSRNFTLSLVKD